MLDKLTNQLEFQAKALVLRSQRQQVLASNIANADTPGYAARDFNFSDALQQATGSSGLGSRLASPGLMASAEATGSASGFMPIAAVGAAADGARLDYAVQTQPAMDGNSVDLDRERAAFADNSVRYEATLRFINNNAKTILAAIQGQ
ncbi:MAG: flagellar basal body rod protein FlgB [Pseudomonadota bacterium]